MGIERGADLFGCLKNRHAMLSFWLGAVIENMKGFMEFKLSHTGPGIQ
jgi:hypothetical protein